MSEIMRHLIPQHAFFCLHIHSLSPSFSPLIVAHASAPGKAANQTVGFRIMTIVKRLITRLFRKEEGPRLDSATENNLNPGKDARLFPRVSTKALDRIQFVAKINGDLIEIPILDLSKSGASLARKALERWPQRGDQLSGEISYNNESIPCTCTVMHISPASVGVRFENPTQEIERMLHRYFSIEISALQLKPVRPDILNKHPDGTPFWFSGSGYSELYYVRATDGTIAAVEISLFGTRMRVTPKTPPIYEEGTEQYLVRRHSIPLEIRDTYIKLVESIENLPPDDRKGLIKAIRNAK